MAQTPLGNRRRSQDDWSETAGTITTWRHPSPWAARLRRWLGTDWVPAFWFLLPSLIIMGGLIAYPFVRAVYVSLTRTHGAQIGPFVGLANYRLLWADRFFRESVDITLRYAGWSVLISLSVAMLAALLLHQLGRRAQILTGLILLPWVMPEIVRAITWKGLLDPLYGTINRVMLNLDLINRPFPFFGDRRTALASVILVNVWQRLPFFTVNLIAGLKAIDQSLYEAAAIDGAGPWQRMIHITLPGIRFVILIVVLMGGIWSLNEFNLVFLLTGGGPMNATQLYSVLAYNYSRIRPGVGAAAALSMAPAFLVLVMVLQRYVVPTPRQEDAVPKTPHLLRGYYRWTDLVRDQWHHLVDPISQQLGAFMAALTAPLRRQRHRMQMNPPSAAAKRRRRWLRVAQQTTSWAVLALLLVFELLPFYWVLITSFKSELQITMFESVLWPTTWVPDQFIKLLEPQRNFVNWLKNTLLLAFSTPVISTTVAAMAAYAVARLRWRGARLFAQAVLLSYLMPVVLLIVPIYQLFLKLGLINKRLALFLAYPTITLPFALWLLIGYYRTLPTTLEDAAAVDGCNHWQLFVRIILPLSKPALVAAVIFGVSQAWSEFMFAISFIRIESRMTVSQGLATLSFGDVQPWGQLAAAALILSIPALLVYATGQRFMLAGLTAGAIKG